MSCSTRVGHLSSCSTPIDKPVSNEHNASYQTGWAIYKLAMHNRRDAFYLSCGDMRRCRLHIGAPLQAPCSNPKKWVRIFPSVLQALVNVIDHGMSLQEAVEAPRVWTQGQDLEVEEAIPPSVRQALMVRGHRVRAVTAVAGGMNGIQFDADTGVMAAAACWRADGSPAALGGGLARPGVRFRTTVRRDRG
jgi:hypothetical protein